MSHYVVGVITKEKPDYDVISEMLAPYDENMSVPDYISETKAEIIAGAKREILHYKELYEKGEHGNPKYYEENTAKYVDDALNDNGARLFEYGTRYAEKDEIDEYGNRHSTYNPNSKWDWYSIGGRFSGYINNGPDVIQLKNFPKPIDLTVRNLKTKYPKEWKAYKDILDGKGDGWYRPEYLQRRYPTFEDYLMATRNTVLYAVLDEDGWHEPGRMGWFGMSDTTEDDDIRWNKNFYEKYIASKDENYWLTIVDCHI